MLIRQHIREFWCFKLAKIHSGARRLKARDFILKLFLLIFERGYLHLRIFMVFLQTSALRFERRILTLQYRILIFRLRQTLSKNSSGTMLSDELIQTVEDTHSFSFSLPNVV